MIEIKDFVEKYGNDRVRFYTTLVMPETKDSSFSWSDFKEKVNGILVATIGNFIHRTLSVGYSARFAGSSADKIIPEVLAEVTSSFTNARKYLEKCEFRNYLDVVVKLAAFGNKLCDEEKIWELSKKDAARFETVMTNLYFIIGSLGYLFAPLMPEASKRLFEMIYANSENFMWPAEINKEFISKVTAVNLKDKPVALFSKVENAVA